MKSYILGLILLSLCFAPTTYGATMSNAAKAKLIAQLKIQIAQLTVRLNQEIVKQQTSTSTSSVFVDLENQRRVRLQAQEERENSLACTQARQEYDNLNNQINRLNAVQNQTINQASEITNLTIRRSNALDNKLKACDNFVSNPVTQKPNYSLPVNCYTSYYSGGAMTSCY